VEKREAHDQESLPTADRLAQSKSGDLAVEGGLTTGEQGILAGVPAQEMRSARMRALVFAGGPYFVDEIGARVIGGDVQVVLQAAFLLAGGRDEDAEFGFEQEVLALLGAQGNHQRDGVFGEPGEFDGARFLAAGAFFCGLALFSIGHLGGIVLQGEWKS
jgi:hypothetical protein